MKEEKNMVSMGNINRAWIVAVLIVLTSFPALAQNRPLENQIVAVLIGEGFHDLETLVPYGYLANRGAAVWILGIEEGVLKAYNSDITLMVDMKAKDARIEDFDALILPGGKGPAVLRQNEDAVEFAARFFRSGKPVAAICHGPQVLITAGVLRGRIATCVGGVSEELKEAGAVYQDESVVRDGNLITSRVPQDIPAFCQMIEKAMIEQAKKEQ